MCGGVLVFFFQAEDGIRDLVRSRGLGDVYKRQQRPDAVFAANDMMALGAYDAVRKSNLRIPEDIAIIGFDNVEILAAQIHPPLTTIELPTFEMGQLAVEMLLGKVDITQDDQPVQRIIECPLIVRRSV